MLRFSKFILLGALALGLSLTLAPTMFAQTNSQAAACAQTYTVQKGDWLSTIALKFMGDVSGYKAVLQATNTAAKTDSSFAKIADANRIEVGQKLCIPAVAPVAGRELAGIYTTVGPAADASALVETLALGGDGKARYTLDYVGKAQIDARGTWKQEGDTVTVALSQQAGKPVKQTLTFKVQGADLVASDPPNATYAKTTPTVAYYSGLYTTNRASADGKETLVALALLPNGQAQLTSNSPDNPFILKTGPWQSGTSADTGAEQITVKLTKQGDQTIDETFVFQVVENRLRGTDYNKDKWGTDLTFSKYQAPAEPQTPAQPPTPATPGKLVAITGSYSEQLPAADAAGRVIVLDLQPNNTATFTTQFLGKGEPTVEKGTWSFDTGSVVVDLDGTNGKRTLTFVFDGGTLVLQNPAAAGYGSEGLHLARAGSDRINNAEFGGVSFSFDQQLAKSAQGAVTQAVPVTQGPALGGAMPASVRFLFNGGKAPAFADYRTPQVNVYRTEDWTKLDPATARTVQALKDLLAAKPADFGKELPLVPPVAAQQVFHAQTKYIDFQNGTGVGFVSYYAQGLSPVLANQIFYTFQGLTNDGKYYVTVFYPITTRLLPTDPKAALGGMSDADWIKNYPQYLDKLVKDLNGLVPAAYTPDLTLIEQMIQSINVGENTLP